jgi:hypothetical protein
MMMMMMMMMGPQLNVSLDPWGAHILHVCKVLILKEVKLSIREQENPHTDLSGN